MLSNYAPNTGILNKGLDFLYGLIIQRTIKQTQITLGVVATKLPTTPVQYRKSMQIFNNSVDIIYIGDSSVTVANGYPIYPRSSENIQIEDNVDVYGISAGAASDVRLCEGA